MDQVHGAIVRCLWLRALAIGAVLARCAGMLIRRSLFALLIASLPACADIEDPALDETESALSASSWSPMAYVGDSKYPTQVATLNGVTYMVQSASDSRDLYWRKRNFDGTWTNLTRIVGQQSNDRVSLAAFNGYLYMMRVYDSSNTNVWFSRFDPSTETWSKNSILTLTTFAGPPAMAAFDNKLFIVGTTEADGSYPMWVATMTTDEVFTSPQPIARQWSASRPSLAVLGSKLYVAHRYGSTGEIVYSTHAPGAAPRLWSGTRFIYAGPGASAIQGDDVSIATANDALHLVHRRFDSNYTWWTYFDQCKWAPELTFDTAVADQPLSLTTSVEGLVISRGNQWYSPTPYAGTHGITTGKFTAPPPSITLPQCLPNAG